MVNKLSNSMLKSFLRPAVIRNNHKPRSFGVAFWVAKKLTTRAEGSKMADSTGEEITTTQENIKPSEKEQPEQMEEEQSKVEAEEEAPKATENGHHTDEVTSEVVEEDKPISIETDEIPKETDVIPKETEEVPKETEEIPKETDKEEIAEDKPSDDLQQKKSEEPKEAEKGHGTMVAKHYNEHKEKTREERKTSRIFYLRNFNNWVKSVLINEFMEKYKRKTFRDLCVLDLGCGKGGDLLKWQKARISNLVCADIAEVSMKQCEQRYKDLKYGRNHRRYNQQTRVYDAQFITADCTKEDLGKKYHGRHRNVKFDMASCQFALHYAFESLEQAERMLQNACERLKPGGYFIGTIPCANEIINRLRQSGDMSIENECYKISFTEKEKFSLFGHKYDFHLEGVVDCPEFLVYFPLLEKMASKFGMTLELAQGFHHFFEEHKDKEEYKFLLSKMNSLETYPPRREGDQSVSDKEDAYARAKEVLEAGEDKDHVGTLSKDEWEAAGLYMVFAFKKAEPEPKPSPMEVEKNEVAKTEQSEPNTDKKDDETVKEDKVEEQDTETKMDEGDETPDKVEEQGTETKMDEGDERPEGDKKVEAADETEEDADKIDEDTDEKEENADKIEEDAGKKEEELVKQSEDTDKKEENVDKKDEDVDKKDEDVDKKDEDVDKKDEDVDKKDEGEKAAVADNTQAEQENEADKQGGETGEQVISEDAEEENTQTPQRGRRKRSVGTAKEEAATPEETTGVTPKRAGRKRKSIGGGEEEPPEKKKA